MAFILKILKKYPKVEAVLRLLRLVRLLRLPSIKLRTGRSGQVRSPQVHSVQVRSGQVFANLLIISGIILILMPVFLQQKFLENKNSIVLSNNFNFLDYPDSIYVPAVTGKVAIGPGSFKNGEWELADNKALYLISSGRLGKLGNVVIYGHSTDNIFFTLKKTNIGDTIILTSKNGRIYKYKVDKIKTVEPTNVEILKQGLEERITVFTCDGLFDSKRFVVSAIRI